MKIAFVSFYNGLIERGAETWTSQLSSRLTSLGHEVAIIHSGSIDQSIFKFTLKVLPILWSQKYQIVFATNGGWQSLLIRLTTWVMGTKMIIVGHSGRGRDDIFNTWCFPNRFVALSNFAKKWTQNVNPFLNIVHIPVGVDVKRFSPHGKKIKINVPRPVILAVAALEKNKQIDLTIKAVSKLQNASLLVLGKGEEEQVLRELGNRLLPDRFLLTAVPFSEMAQYYRSAQVFTLCSWTRESYPAVYLEAMASNLPVVATADPIRQEIVGDAGLLVDPHNSQGYAAALTTALDTNWRKLPRTQAEKFSWDKMALEYEKMLAGL